MIVRGLVFLDNVQGTRVGGQPVPDTGDWLAAFDTNGTLLGTSRLDVSGLFDITVYGNPSIVGTDITFRLCDQRAAGSREVSIDEHVSFFPSTTSWPPAILSGRSIPTDPLQWFLDDDPANFKAPMTITATVTVHGVPTTSPDGWLGAFWAGPFHNTGPINGVWVHGTARPLPGIIGPQIYRITVFGYNEGDQIEFAVVSEDPLSGKPAADHLGISGNFISFLPGGQIGSQANPFEIVLLHPPALTAAIPGQTVSTSESFGPFDLDDFIVNPTGQKIDWSVRGAQNLLVSIDTDNVVSIAAVAGWTGAEVVTFSATHPTGEITEREVRFVRYDVTSNYPIWESPAVGAFSSGMLITADVDASVAVSIAANNRLAAFVDGEIRGVTSAVKRGGKFVFELPVEGDLDGQTVQFMAHDMINDEIYALTETVQFQHGGAVGNLEMPLRLGSLATGVTDEPEVPTRAGLRDIWPNPSSEITHIRFELIRPASVRVDVFDVLGRRVSSLLNRRLSVGKHQVEWGRTNAPAGIYAIHLVTGNSVFTRLAVRQ